MKIMPVVVTGFLVIGIGLLVAVQWTYGMTRSLKDYCINKVDIQHLFAVSAHAIPTLIDTYIENARAALHLIIEMPKDKRTVANTLQAYDELMALSDLSIFFSILYVLEAMSPDEAIRDAAHVGIVRINAFWVDEMSNNKMLYAALKNYAKHNKQSLNSEQYYFLQEIVAEFKRAGLDLPDALLQEIKTIKKELAAHEIDFERAITHDKHAIKVPLAALAGLNADTIDSFSRGEDGLYCVGVDYPTYNAVMEHCVVEDTRKALYKAFSNRAYPENHARLQTIIQKRAQLASLLGYKSYAHLDLADQMVQSPERAHDFLRALMNRAAVKEVQEIELLKKHLPQSVTLENGKIKPWDIRHMQTHYKQEQCNLDERVIAEYFPMDATIEGLLAVYRSFLAIEFEEQPITGLWHDEVRLIVVYNQEKTEVLGYLLLDLFPRPNKYSHAAHMSILHAYYDSSNKRKSAVSVVVANFPRGSSSKPSLLMRADVRTFFHEFGHALHSILGATSIVSFAGTQVKRDFVELPSQMLEEWLWDSAIIKQVSSHYITQEKIPDELIATMIALKHFDTGIWVQTQAWYACMSLDYFDTHATKDPYITMKALHEKHRSHFTFDADNHMYASFGHLMGYKAKYYGYLWSKVFALDMFAEIKKQGLLNPLVGKKYIREVIGKGGCQDPNQLLINFLGREPQQQAFFDDLGI